MQSHDLLVILDPRQIEQLDGNAALFQHGGHAQDAEAHEDALVEQESRWGDDETDRRFHTNRYLIRFQMTRTVWYHLIFLPSLYERP